MESQISSAERAIDNLNVAAAYSSLSKDEFISAINKLTQLDFHTAYGPHIRSSFTLDKLLRQGLSENELTGLEPILRKTSNGNEMEFVGATIPNILFVFSIVRHRMEEFFEKYDWQEWFRSIGVLLCETLCNPAASEKAAEFLSNELLHKIKNLLISILSKQIENSSRSRLLSIIHMISSCGEYKKSIVPANIQKVNLHSTRLPPDDATAVGDVLSYASHIGTLDLENCYLNANSLGALRVSLDKSDVQIAELNVSRNEDVGVDGARCLGDIVKKQSIEKLSMKECGLRHEHLKSFNEGSGEAKIAELDVSNNNSMGVDGTRCVGDIVKNHSIEKLSMEYCGLQYQHLKSFNERSGEAKIAELNVSNNEAMDVKGAGCVGNIAKKHSIAKLSMENCRLTYKRVNSFVEHLGVAKICELEMNLYVKFEQRFHVLLRLMTKVTKTLTLKHLFYITSLSVNDDQKSLIEIYAALTGLDVFLDSENPIRDNNMTTENAHELLQDKLLKSQGQQLLDAILIASYFEEHLHSICPAQVPIFNLTGAVLSKYAAKALVKMFRHITYIKQLRLSNCQMKPGIIREFSNGFLKSLEISVLDISKNDTIGVRGTGCIGDIVNNHSVGNLNLSDCGLSYKHLTSFQKHVKDAKISHLDLSGNENMGVDGLGTVGDLVLNCKTDSLSLAACGLSSDHLYTFNKHAIDCKISVLDVSGNESLGIQGAGTLGHIVSLKCVKKLVLNCCGLTYEHFYYFDEHSDRSVIDELDLSWNVGMGMKTVGFIGDIVSNHSVKNLTMQYCRLAAEEVESLSFHLEKTEIKELDLSSQTLPKDHEYEFPTKAVCSLVNVVDILDLSGNKLEEADKSLLQYHIDHSELHVIQNVRIFVDDSELKSSVSSSIRRDYVKKENVRDFKDPFIKQILKSGVKYEPPVKDDVINLEETESDDDSIASEKFDEDDSIKPEPYIKGERFETAATDPFPTTTSRGAKYEPRVKHDVVKSEQSRSEDDVMESEKIDEYGFMNPEPFVKAEHFDITASDPFPTMRSREASTAPPFITCTEEIGPEGGRITVGDCFIEFQPGTFTKFRKVTVTARIDRSEWPEGEEVITPVLDVKLGKIHKPAKVQLSTWAIPHVEKSTDVLIVHRTNNDWEVIQTQRLGSNGIVEFQCNSFSLVTALVSRVKSIQGIVGKVLSSIYKSLPPLKSPPLPKAFTVTLYYYHKQFYISFHLKSKVLSKSIRKDLTEVKFKSEPECPISFEMPCNEKERVEINLECSNPTSGFSFDPQEKLIQSINQLTLSGKISCCKHYVLYSEQHAQSKEEIRIRLIATNGSESERNTHSFLYDWNPDDKRSMKRHTQISPQTNPSKKRKVTEDERPSTSIATRLGRQSEADDRSDLSSDKSSSSSDSRDSVSPDLERSSPVLPIQCETRDDSQSSKLQNVINVQGNYIVQGDVSMDATRTTEDLRGAAIQNLNQGRQRTTNKDSKSDMTVLKPPKPT